MFPPYELFRNFSDNFIIVFFFFRYYVQQIQYFRIFFYHFLLIPSLSFPGIFRYNTHILESFRLQPHGQHTAPAERNNTDETKYVDDCQPAFFFRYGT